MKISVLIATRNRLSDLRFVLNRYRTQTYKNFEIVIIDNGSTDGTKEALPLEFPEVKYFWLPENFDIRALNIALNFSDGEIIWRCDSDSYPDNDDCFERIISIFEKHESIDFVATELIELSRGGVPIQWYPLEVDKLNTPDDGYKSNVFLGGGTAIRRRVFDKIGGFWEFGFEESDFAFRAIIEGFNIRYFPNIKTLHIGSISDRNREDRWIQMSKQYVRLQSKFFPLPIAIYRTLVAIVFQMLEGILKLFSPLAWLECLFSMCAASFRAFRKERCIIPREKLYDITLGRGFFTNYINYWKYVIKNKSTHRK
jgi:glycosyltransferase involved in cell wall biosynthesis